MLQHVSIDVLANWVLMLRADVDGAILLSDDNEEARFYERCVHRKAQVVPASEVAGPLLERIERRGVHGVVAAFRGTQPLRDAPNVFRPSIGDIASVLLLSESSNKVVGDICGGAWLKSCEKTVGPLRKRAAWIARIVVRLRQLCSEPFLLLPNGHDWSEVVDWNTFELAWDRLDPILGANGVSPEALREAHAIRPGRDLRSDLSECDGMDVVHILATATRMYQPRGISALRRVESGDLMCMLRVAFDLGEFENDAVFWRMRKWERANGQYPLLCQWRTLDPLGIVWDQRYWQEDLSALLGILKNGEQLAMFKMDLDNFKQVN